MINGGFQFPDGNYFYLDQPPGTDPLNPAPNPFQFPDGNYFYLDYSLKMLGAHLEWEFQFPDGNYFYLDSGPLETLWLKGFRGNLREPTVKGPLFTMLW